MVIKPLEKKDSELLLKIYNMKARDIYPAKPVEPDSAVFFESIDPFLINFEFAGIYDNSSLKAAVYFGILSKDSKPWDFNIIRPGEGIISWFLCAEQKAGDKLLKYALKKLKTKVFAFPQAGGFNKFCLFNNGMLPSFFKIEEAVLKQNGFKIPEGKDWGPQERIWFKKDIFKDIRPELPAGLKTKHEIQGKLRSSLKIFDKEKLIGECSISQVNRCGKPYPEHIYTDWLFVDGSYRGKAIGQNLLLSQLKWAHDNGARVSVLTTHSGRPAHNLYRKMGYKEVCISRTFYIE
jgi:ribosomal protein S18 acetylase RimI-like enzyme